MKIKKGFAKREIAGSYIVVPVGAGNQILNGMITLNETGSFIWDSFQKDRTIDDVAVMLTNEYEVTLDKAKTDVEKFVDMLRENNLIEE